MAARPVSHQTSGWLHRFLPGAGGLGVLVLLLTFAPQGSEAEGEGDGGIRDAASALVELDRSAWSLASPLASPVHDMGAPRPHRSKRAPAPPPQEPSTRVVPGLSLAFIPGPDEGAPPQEWQLQEFTGAARFTVAQVRGTGVIRLESEETSFALHRDVEVDLAEFPYLSWSWRVDVLPEGGDVRRREADDQAAQLYVVFPLFPAMLRTRVLGYVWDATAPAGSSLASAATSLARIVVMQSGPGKAGRWLEETRNIREDYRRLFHEEPPPVGKVSVFINSQHTRSRAVAWFGPIRFSAEPPRRGAVPLQATLLPLP